MILVVKYLFHKKLAYISLSNPATEENKFCSSLVSSHKDPLANVLLTESKQGSIY